MHKRLICAYKSKNVAQNQRNFARSHDRETMTFRNSVLIMQLKSLWDLGCPKKGKFLDKFQLLALTV